MAREGDTEIKYHTGAAISVVVASTIFGNSRTFEFKYEPVIVKDYPENFIHYR